jgi:DNA-directed RNA polymerase specialized sigma24 family protein
MGRGITAEEFEKLYGATARDVLAYVRRRACGDAEDLVAEVYAVAWRRRSDLPAPMLRRAWLFGVARKLLIAEGRQHQHQRQR